jgi:hypothetical protein
LFEDIYVRTLSISSSGSRVVGVGDFAQYGLSLYDYCYDDHADDIGLASARKAKLS